MLLDILLILWIGLIALAGANGGITVNKRYAVKGIAGIIIALVLFPIIGVFFLFAGAILAFPFLYWLVF